MQTSTSLPEPYRCRLKYLWAGLRDTTRHSARAHLRLAASRRSHPVARLMAPFVLLLLLGFLADVLVRPIVFAARALTSGRTGDLVGNFLLAGLVLLPILLCRKAWLGAKRLCYHGWALGQPPVAPITPTSL
jgi:hypothetical protein